MVWLLPRNMDDDGLPVAASLKQVYQTVNKLMQQGKVLAAYTPGLRRRGRGRAENDPGQRPGLPFRRRLHHGRAVLLCLWLLRPGADRAASRSACPWARTTAEAGLTWQGNTVTGDELLAAYENKLEPIYACNIDQKQENIPTLSHESDSWKQPLIKSARPKVLIPVFPGTNCEYDAAKAMRNAGAEPEILVINNLTATGIARVRGRGSPRPWARLRSSSCPAASPAATSRTAPPSSSPPSSATAEIKDQVT